MYRENLLAGPQYFNFVNIIWFATNDKLIYYCSRAETIISTALEKKLLKYNKFCRLLLRKLLITKHTNIATYMQLIKQDQCLCFFFLDTQGTFVGKL